MEINIEKNWDTMAEAYEEFTEGEDSYSYKIEWPCIKTMTPDLKNKNVLDLGCGTGRFTFLLEEYSPARLVGIDISENMLKLADEKAKKRKSIAEFIKGDIAEASSVVNDKYDFIFSSTTTHFIKDLNKLFKEVYKLLNNGGTAVFSVIHPVYSAQYPIKNGDNFPSDDEWVVKYLDKGDRSYIQPWIEYNDDIDNYLTMSYHHTLNDYVKAIISSGFIIEAMEEPYPPEKWKETQPGRYDGYIETPTYMIIKIKKN